MTLVDQLRDYVNAAFSGLWMQTHEPDEAQREIATLCEQQQWQLKAWDCADGVAGEPSKGEPQPYGIGPLTNIRKTQDGSLLVVLHNFHLFIRHPLVMQKLFNRVIEGKQSRTFWVVLSHQSTIPAELEKVFVVLQHELPSRETLFDIAVETIGDGSNAVTDCENASITAAAGLTRYEAEGSFALSIARHGDLKPDTVWELKTSALKKSGLATLYRGNASFASLRGCDHIRELARKLLRPGCPIPPKGFLLVGPPGGGKTSIARAIAADNGLPLIVGDPGSWMKSHVGESQELVRRFIAVCEAMAPCCVLVDEIEDALAGATSDHVGDGGVAKDQLRALLTWRSDSTSRIFFLATCNDPKPLMSVKDGAFLRDGRFDGIVFVDLPDRAQKDAIWDLYLSKHGLMDGNGVPDDEGWTPGNIEACCQRAVQYDVTLQEAARYVRKPDGTQVNAIREWASGRCLSAAHPGIYQHDFQPSKTTTNRRAIAKRS